MSTQRKSTPERATRGKAADPFTAPDARAARSGREHAGLTRIAERHATTDTQRHRQLHPTVLNPHEAVRLIGALAAGSAQLDRDEPEVDHADLVAALTLIPKARAEMDALETSLLMMA